MITRIHVNGQNLRANKNGNSVFVARDYRCHRKGDQVVVHGPSKLIYRPKNPLKWKGERAVVAWIETEADVDVYWGEEKQERLVSRKVRSKKFRTEGTKLYAVPLKNGLQRYTRKKPKR